MKRQYRVIIESCDFDEHMREINGTKIAVVDNFICNNPLNEKMLPQIRHLIEERLQKIANDCIKKVLEEVQDE